MKAARALGLVLAVGASDCVEVTTTPFDPTGGPVEVVGSWTVDGQTPSVAVCGPIDTVRLVICDDTNTFCYEDPEGLFTYPCDAGTLDVVNALLRDRYYTHWEAYDVAGNLIAESSPTLLDVTSTTITTAILQGIDFVL